MYVVRVRVSAEPRVLFWRIGVPEETHRYREHTHKLNASASSNTCDLPTLHGQRVTLNRGFGKVCLEKQLFNRTMVRVLRNLSNLQWRQVTLRTGTPVDVMALEEPRND